jgi:aminopeptidase N
MYPKGGNMLHTIRQLVGSDEKWCGILRGLNRTFWHQAVTGKRIEDYLSQQAGIDLSQVFDQYLRTTRVPVFDYAIEGSTLSYRWVDVVPGFDMPVRIIVSGTQAVVLRPTEAWQSTTLAVPGPSDVRVDPNYYVIARTVVP